MTTGPTVPAGETTSGRLREEEIRPDRLRARQVELFASDVARLRARAVEFVEVPCPACGRPDGRHRFDKVGFRYLECEACATIYISPRPAPAVLDDYYAQAESYRYWAEHIFPATEGARRERIFQPRVDRIVDLCDTYGVPRETLLEVGTGFGTFCEVASSSGAFGQVIGVEPTPDLAEHCRSRGITIIEKPVEHVDLDELPPPDVIASFETIEHLFAPRSFIEACARVLRPGGLLVLTCPNGRGFDVVVLEELTDTVDAEHLNYFNPASLSAAVAACGLEVLEVSTPGQLDVDLVRRKGETGEWDPSTSPFLRQVLFEEADRLSGPFQAFLADNLLSSHLWLVARKPEVDAGS